MSRRRSRRAESVPNALPPPPECDGANCSRFPLYRLQSETWVCDRCLRLFRLDEIRRSVWDLLAKANGFVKPPEALLPPPEMVNEGVWIACQDAITRHFHRNRFVNAETGEEVDLRYVD